MPRGHVLRMPGCGLPQLEHPRGRRRCGNPRRGRRRGSAGRGGGGDDRPARALEPVRPAAGPQVQLGPDRPGDDLDLREAGRRHNRRAMSRVAVIGAGYVGLTTAACLADLGNDVTVVDVDEARIAMLQRRQVPIYEPGISELVERNSRAGRLRFTTSYLDAVPGAEYAIIAVSTPEGEGGEADLSYVEAAASSIADAMDGPLVVINKSTVPPLTGDMVSEVLKRRNSEFAAAVVSNPEFLR